jgi:two-component system, LytTR family, sensor histidine kinase LytS
MKQFDWTHLYSRPYKVYAQFAGWMVVFSLFILLKEYPQRMSGMTLICLVFQQVLELAIPSYTQNLLILPFFRRRRWGLGILLYLSQLVLLVILLPYLLNGVGAFFGALFGVTDLADWRKEHIAFSVVAFTVIATFFKISFDRLMLDKQRKDDELRHLKAQLNPHFLFNTLNNLYGLSVAESKMLPELMLRLSDLLRYSLYDTNQQYVSLQKEVEYIANYVELEKIRWNDGADIRLDVQGDVTGQHIAPLLLIVFIENAFKHLSVAKGRQACVQILIAVKEGKLHLQVKNSVDPALPPPPVQTGRRKGGLGLDNARKRLNLIYPDQYTLTIKRLPESFEVECQIELI